MSLDLWITIRLIDSCLTSFQTTAEIIQYHSLDHRLSLFMAFSPTPTPRKQCFHPTWLAIQAIGNIVSLLTSPQKVSFHCLLASFEHILWWRPLKAPCQDFVARPLEFGVKTGILNLHPLESL